MVAPSSLPKKSRGLTTVGRLLSGMLLVISALAGQVLTDFEWKHVRSFGVDGGTILFAAFSPDGTALAVTSQLGELRVLDMPAQKLRWQARPSDHWVGALEFSPDGKRIACRGRHLTIHDARSGELQFRVDDIGPRGFEWARDRVSFAFAKDGAVCVHNGKAVQEWASFEYPVNTLSFAGDGGLFVGDNIGRVWRVPKGGGEAERIRDHRPEGGDTVSAFAVACAGGVLFDLPNRGDLRRGDQKLAVPGPSFAFAVTSDGQSFAVGGRKKIVRWWRSGGKTSRDIVVKGSVAALALHPDGETLFVSTYSGQQALHSDDLAPIAVASMPSGIERVVMTADASLIAVKGRAWTLHPMNGAASRPLPRAFDLSAGRTGSELIVREATRTVLFAGRLQRELAVLDGRGLLFESAAGPRNLVLVGDELVDWAGKFVSKMPDSVPFSTWKKVAHASDGSWAVGTIDGHHGQSGGLVVTDSKGRVRGSLDEGPVYTLAFSPDSSRIYYACGLGHDILGGAPTGRAFRVVDAKTLNRISSIPTGISHWRFLDARRALAIVSGKLQVWDAENLTPLRTLPVERPCRDFELSTERRTVVVRSETKVHVYRY